MTSVLLVIHVIIAVALVAVILLQRSEGGALGIGGGGGFMSARGAGNALTRATAILATFFLASCLGLTILQSVGREQKSIVDTIEKQQLEQKPAPAPAPETPTVPLSN